MKISTRRVSTHRPAATKARGDEPAAADGFATLLQATAEPQSSTEDTSETLDASDELDGAPGDVTEDEEDDTRASEAAAALLVPADSEPLTPVPSLIPGLPFPSRSPQSHSAADSASHALPGDPRRFSVDGDGDVSHPTDRGPTAREPGNRARGLRLDSARPGGAGADIHRIQSRRTLSGSRGFPAPHPPAAPEAARADVVVDEAEVPGPLQPAQDEGMRAAAGREVEAREALRRGRGSGPTKQRLQDLGARPTEGAFELPDMDELDAALDRLDAPQRELSTEGAEAPLPPARPDGSPARIRLDPGLTLEVDVQEESVEVTLEGDAEAIEPLSDLGRELQDALEADGFDLDSFGQRRRKGERRTDLYRPRRTSPRSAEQADQTPDASASRPRGGARGQHVDILV